jgi:prevent-host-death family protein
MQERFDELVHEVEQGETVVVTRDGKPVFNLVPSEKTPAEKKGGIDFDAMQSYMRSIGVDDPFPYVAEDFDDPLPEDFLLRPLP